MHGAAALVHLAGAGGTDLETLFRVNSRGLFDTFEAARNAGVRRIVFASSNHAHGFYPITFPVSPEQPARPDGHYGALKAYGELILRSYFDRYAIRSVSLRIGTYRPLPIDQRSLATWLSPADMVQLAERSLLHPDPGALVVNAYSNNTRLKVARTHWDFLGYAPADNAEEHREMLRAQGIDVDGPWEFPDHGGSFARDPELPARLP
jgi:uronate dehydrogenase